MRMPDAGPFGETFFEARLRAIVAALFVNNPSGGYVDVVLTPADHLRFVPFLAGVRLDVELFLAAVGLRVVLFLAGIFVSPPGMY
jgi:hypothetical protein